MACDFSCCSGFAQIREVHARAIALLNMTRFWLKFRGWYRPTKIENAMVLIRPVRLRDIAAVSEIGSANYPKNYYEGEEAFASKITGYMRGCFVAEIDGEIVGYIISLPWHSGSVITPANFYTPPHNPNCLYIHDVCVKLEYRNRGIASRLIKRVLDLDAWDRIGLVAALGSGGFWRQFGFAHILQIEYCDAAAEYMQLKR
jgi:predicted N-acetyltransferase YhbS